MKSHYLKSLTIIVILFISGLANSQTFSWAQGIGGTGADASYYSTTDASGNVYIVGGFSGTVDFDSGAGTSTVTSIGGTDGYVVKLNSSGVFQWVRTIGGTGTDRVNSISIDGTGNIYIAGIFNVTADFDPGAGTYNLTSAGSEDVFISKWNSSGNFIWAGRLAGAGSQDANQIVVDASGNVYVVGEFTQTVDFDPGAGSTTAVANTSTPDMFILKLTTAGVFSWVRTYGIASTYFDRAEDIDFDPLGNLVIVGDYSNTIDFDPGAGVFNLTAWGTNPDAFVLKLDPNGNFINVFGFGGSNWDKIEDVDIDASGNIYVTGYFQGTVDFDPSATSFNMSSAGGSDIFVAKYSSSGNLVWAKKMGTSAGPSDTGYGITVTTSGEVFTTGEYRGNNCDFDPGAGTFNLSAGTTNSNIYVQKLDANGNFLFAAQTGGANLTDYAGAVWFDAVSNAVYICGSFSGTTDLDVTASTYTAVSAGSTDGFIIKLSTCVAPSAPVNVTSSTLQTICAGNSTTLTTTSSGTVTWHSTTTSTAVIGSGLSYNTPTLSAGTYTYYAQSNTACGSSATRASITVTVNPTPTVNISSSSSTLCSGQSATLTASGASNYAWSTGGTSASIVVSPTTSTTYTVSGITLGCTSSRTTTITVNPTPTVNISSSSSTLCSGQSATLTASGASNYAWSNGGTSASIVVSPTTSTTYTVSGITLGCTSNRTTTVTVNPTPTVNISSNSSTLCSGQSATLTASGASNYAWSNGGTSASIVVSPTTSTTYTVSGTTFGCTSSRTTTITVNPTPTVNISSSSSTLCSGQSATLTASGASNYAWSNGGTSASIVVSPTTSTTYTVNGTTSGCTSSKTVTLQVSICSGLDEVSKAFNVVLFPNPSTGQVTISNANLSGMKIVVTDTYGRVIILNEAESDKYTFELPHGLYYVSVKAKDGAEARKKLIITR